MGETGTTPHPPIRGIKPQEGHTSNATCRWQQMFRSVKQLNGLQVNSEWELKVEWLMSCLFVVRCLGKHFSGICINTHRRGTGPGERGPSASWQPQVGLCHTFSSGSLCLALCWALPQKVTQLSSVWTLPRGPRMEIPESSNEGPQKPMGRGNGTLSQSRGNPKGRETIRFALGKATLIEGWSSDEGHVR